MYNVYSIVTIGWHIHGHWDAQDRLLRRDKTLLAYPCLFLFCPCSQPPTGIGQITHPLTLTHARTHARSLFPLAESKISLLISLHFLCTDLLHILPGS